MKYMKVDRGDTLFQAETPGGYNLTPYDPDFEEQMKSASKLGKKYRNALREVAR